MKRLKPIGITSLILLVGFLIIYFGATPEPQYQGRVLTDWLKDAETAQRTLADPDHPERDPAWLNCQKAVRQMGTNVIPFLLNDLLAEASKIKPRLDAWASGPIFSSFIKRRWQNQIHQFVNADQQKVMERRILAMHGFALLQQEAKSVEPILIRQTKDKQRDKRFWGYVAFVCLRPPKEIFIPVARSLLKDSDKEIRDTAAQTFIALYPQEARENDVYVLFPEFRPDQPNQVRISP